MTGNITNRRKPSIPRNASRRSQDLLDDLAGLAEGVLTGQGMEPDAARAAAAAIATELRRHWGGQQLYFPRAEYLDVLAERDAEMMRRFDGTPDCRDRLCSEYGISAQRFYRILSVHRARRRAGSSSTPRQA